MNMAFLYTARHDHHRKGQVVVRPEIEWCLETRGANFKCSASKLEGNMWIALPVPFINGGHSGIEKLRAGIAWPGPFLYLGIILQLLIRGS